MSEENRCMRYDMALRSTYDELYELNLTHDTYQTIHKAPDKYVSPVKRGCLSEALSLIARQIVHPEDTGRFLAFFSQENMRRTLSEREYVRGEFRKLCRNGGYKWVSLLVIPAAAHGDEIWLVYVSDVDEKRGARELARENELLKQRKLDSQRYQIIVERTNTIVIEWNTDPEMFYYSPKAANFRFMNHLNRRLNRIWLSYRDVHPDDWRSAREAARRLLDGADDVELTARLYRTDGRCIWCKCTATALRHPNGEIRRLIVTVNNADAAVNAQRTLAYHAEYDQLTGYGNFDKFKRQVRDQLRNRGERNCSLWYSDLKNFKYINDIYGYDTGDKLLRCWADIIAADLGPDETFARISADNFALFRYYEDRQELSGRFEDVAKRMQRFEEGISKNFPIEIVAGVYCVEGEGEPLSVEDMIDRANMAQKTVKPLPGSRMAIYTEEMRSRVILEKNMESEMERALREGEFCVYLQGQVDIQTGNRISGAEALARWNHPVRGMIPPSEFIPLFEKNGFIVELDRYIYGCVCQYLAERVRNGEPLFKIAINASRLTLLQPDFLERYTEIKNAYGIPDGLLELECTETVLIENLQEIGDAAARLRESGFLLGMDDFGSGYSSLNVLKDVVVDVLKLDMAFFQNGLTRERDRAIVASIVSMAGALDMHVVAEGVESMEQVTFLRRIGCDTVQGYVFSRPVPMNAFRADVVFASDGAEVQAVGGMCREAETRALFLLSNGVPGAVIKLKNDARLTVCQVSGQLEQLTGYSRDEMRTLFSNELAGLMVPEDALRVGKVVQRLERHCEQVCLEYRIHRKDGMLRWISDTRFPGCGNGGLDCYSVLTDITAVRELEASVRQNAQCLQMIMDYMMGGICIFELTDTIRPIYMNRGYFTMFGYNEDEYWRDRAGDILANLYQEDARKIVSMARQSARTHEMFGLTYRLRKRAGNVGYVQMRAVELPSEKRKYPVFLALLSDISQLKETQEQLADSIERQSALMDNLPGGVAVFEMAETLRVRYISEGVYNMSGYSREEFEEASRSGNGSVLFPKGKLGFQEKVLESVSSDRPIEYLYSYQRDKGIGWTMIRGRLIMREPGKYPLLYTVFLDMTAQKEAELELKIQAERYSLLEQTLQESLFEYDVRRDVMELTSREQGILRRRRIDNYLESVRETPAVPRKFAEKQREIFMEACKTALRTSFEVPIRNAAGQFRWSRVILSSVEEERGRVARVVGRVFDIHEDAQGRLEAEERALRDQMTLLYHKMAGEKEARRCLAAADPKDEATLLMIDLDNFKQVNDSFGHRFGDKVLEKTSDLMREIFPEGALLSRFGGDEFLVFMENQKEPKQLAEEFQNALCGWQNGKCAVRCSIGIAQSNIKDFSLLFRMADEAMYQAKQMGKSRCVFWNSGEPANYPPDAPVSDIL